MSRGRRVEISFLFHPHDFSSIAGYVWPLLGITGPYGVPPALANDSCLVLSMTSRTSRICLLYSKKNGALSLWQYLSTSMKRQPQTWLDSKVSVPGGHAITFRASALRTYHSVGRKEPRNKVTLVGNWRSGPLNVRGVQGVQVAPIWFGHGYHSKGLQGLGLHSTCLGKNWTPHRRIKLGWTCRGSVRKDQTSTEPFSRSSSNQSYQRHNVTMNHNRIAIYYFRSIAIERQTERPPKISTSFQFSGSAIENWKQHQNPQNYSNPVSRQRLKWMRKNTSRSTSASTHWFLQPDLINTLISSTWPHDKLWKMEGPELRISKHPSKE